MKIDLTSIKGNYTADHYSIIQEIDQVQKKQTVHKARFADIHRKGGKPLEDTNQRS